jgi:ppGpp synthetase/RelA/SpoT-type nucleotidyltranferase
MIEKTDFIEKHQLSEEELSHAQIDWIDLEQIYEDYSAFRPNLEPTASYIADRLRQVSEVHSLKYRVKHPEHLIEKIICKWCDGAGIDISNYRTEVTDLFGVRALHLFKDDWHPIHDFITSTWDLHEKPVTNIRNGDSERIVESFKRNGCEINEHEFGYRSVHYLVESKPEKDLIISELQVRTLFEEGWSEIDHQVRYPYDLDNTILAHFLVVFNRLAGAADEMGSYVKLLKKELSSRESEAQRLIEEKNETIRELKEKIESLKIEKEEKHELGRKLDSLSFSEEQLISGSDILGQDEEWMLSSKSILQSLEDPLADLDSRNLLGLDDDALSMANIQVPPLSDRFSISDEKGDASEDTGSDQEDGD